jgi:hypothetical protein
VPFCIMDPELAHLYCPATQNVLSWTGRARVSGGQDPSGALDPDPT